MTLFEFFGLALRAVLVFGSMVAIILVGAVTAGVLVAATLPASFLAMLTDFSRWLVADDER
mgnify:CR=1 FL=1